ncbi:hypothetical protein [Haloarchaeobius baliensis]|uniref:hypothetical protein n=1 Tax=Haloarchaeobius baliensis TaxID=1670458 RepID=UPI003F884DE2
MTERTTDRESRTDNRTMADVSHTNPFTGESMGQVFEHGVTIVADGGRDPVREDARPFDAGEPDDGDSEVMADVRHTTDDDAANRVFERGGERGTGRQEY